MTFTSLSGRSFAVTGGAGTIGSHVVEQLLAAGARHVAVIDTLERGRLDNLPHDSRVTLVNADIRDHTALAATMRGADTVFHLAALRITQCAAEPRRAHDVLATGTLDVALAALENGVRRLVFSSSASVYGQATAFPTQEDHHPWANDTIYGAAKAYGEGMLRALRSTHGLDYIALRYFNVIGPRMDAHGKYTEVLIRWMERIAIGEPPVILGDGTQTMDFIDVRDVARANLAAARADVTDRVYNIASGHETSLAALATLLVNAMGRPDLRPTFGPERSVNAVRRRLAATDLARTELGFASSIPLEQTLTDLVEWWRSTVDVGEAREEGRTFGHARAGG
jgi:UDP-glucose 4-epimerase